MNKRTQSGAKDYLIVSDTTNLVYSAFELLRELFRTRRAQPVQKRVNRYLREVESLQSKIELHIGTNDKGEVVFGSSYCFYKRAIDSRCDMVKQLLKKM